MTDTNKIKAKIAALLAKAKGTDNEHEAAAFIAKAEATLEALRPVWAMGYTDDSQAAQANGNALAELWQLLHAKDQTQAMTNLRSLIEMAATVEPAFRAGFGAGMDYASAGEFPVSMADTPDEDTAWIMYQEGTLE